MQITETLALADLTAVFSAALAAIVAITGYRNTKQSARQTFDNFTLRFIETENADGRLHAARQWLEQAVADPDENLALYADIRQFFAARHLSDGLKVQEEGAEGAIRYRAADHPEVQRLLQRYRIGSSHMESLVEIRNTAAEALLHGLLEENAYRLIRRRAFLHDYAGLEGFILARQKNDGEYARAFCRLVQRWQNPD